MLSEIQFPCRHNNISAIITVAAADAGYAVEREANIGCKQRPADVLITPRDEACQPVAIDLTIVHPLAPSCNLVTKETTQVAEAAENRKLEKYEALCQSQGLSLFPVGNTAFGGVDPSGTIFSMSSSPNCKAVNRQKGQLEFANFLPNRFPFPWLPWWPSSFLCASA